MCYCVLCMIGRRGRPYVCALLMASTISYHSSVPLMSVHLARSVLALHRGLTNRAFSTVFVRGSGVFGALGLNNNLQDAPKFHQVPAFCDSNDEIASVSAGWGHSLALAKAGKLYVWGRPHDFDLVLRLRRATGMAPTLGRSISRAADSIFHFWKPDEVFRYDSPILLAKNVTNAAASAGLTAFIDSAGHVFCFGVNRWQQCGIFNAGAVDADSKGKSTNERPILQPVRVADLPVCTAIDTGLQHCLAMTANGDVYSWGKGNNGQLGHTAPSVGNPDISTLAKRVPLLNDRGHQVRAKAISAGLAHSAAISESDGSIFVWGKGMSEDFKQSRNRKSGAALVVADNQYFPRQVFLPNDLQAVEICSSQYHVVIRANDDSLWVLGVGEMDNDLLTAPTRVCSDYRTVDSDSPKDVFPAHQYKMVKGHKRVALVSKMDHINVIMEEEEAEAARTPAAQTWFDRVWGVDVRQKHARCFDIVVNNGESFLFGVDTEGVVSSTGREMVDYSRSWVHELMIVK